MYAHTVFTLIVRQAGSQSFINVVDLAASDLEKLEGEPNPATRGIN
jgi:hypothetical protein